MKSKGFTLVELIAIIIVLGLTITLATPTVISIMNKSKQKAFIANIQGIVKAIDTDHFDKSDLTSAYNIQNGKVYNYFYNEDLKVKNNTNNVNGYIYVDENGKKFGNIYDNEMCAIYENNEVVYQDYCSYNVYGNGNEVKFNPDENVICNVLNTELDAKSGCMKWYIFNDNSTNSYVDMILDHDTTIAVPFNSENKPVINEAKIKLEEDTANWYKYLSPRLIKAKEITQITGFDFNNLTDYYYLSTNSQTESTYAEGAHPYKWLINNTSGCKPYGCDVERTGEWGYWTSDIAFDTNIWHIRYNGTLHAHNSANVQKGIRPVVRIHKSLLN